MTDTPLIQLKHLTRYFGQGDSRTIVLDDISLEIAEGEFVAIMGPSGSGKSTLLNHIGCLDTPNSGSLKIDGQSTESLSGDELSQLRLRIFGFIFQKYHLVPGMSATENVALPALYAGVKAEQRHSLALRMLEQVELGERATYKPSELSGGQQQRVAIARAMINEPKVLIADEPTGALDSQSGDEILALLESLNRNGQTIIMVTHDDDVAARAQRVIRLRDGKVESDNGQPGSHGHQAQTASKSLRREQKPNSLTMLWEAFGSATRALQRNRLRTALTMLGIIIGVSSVVAMMGIGAGAREDVLAEIHDMGSNLLRVKRGSSQWPVEDDYIHSMRYDDLEAILELPGVVAAKPKMDLTVTLRHGSEDTVSKARAINTQFPEVRSWPVQKGVFFNRDDQENYAKVAAIGSTAATRIFGDEDPLGEILLVENAPFRVIAVMAPKGLEGGSGDDKDNQVFLPHTTMGALILGHDYFDEIIVKVAGDADMYAVADRVFDLVLERHDGQEDFHVRNMMEEVEAAEETQRTFNMLMAFIAGTSLLVGGIGVMNIMLVSVTERTQEIGIRNAVGARHSDILGQFLIEAVLICLLGGLIGAGLGLALCLLLENGFGVTIVYSLWPVVIALTSAVVTGLIFGAWPAHQATELTPADALSRD